MDPVPQTRRALEEFMESDESDLAQVLAEMGRAAEDVVPECVGLSLTLVHEGLTFTLVASDLSAAAVDAAQYLDGGPCDRDNGRRDVVQASMTDLLDEGRWSLFAAASAAAGIASSLSLPLVGPGNTVIGGINLYAATVDAFSGHHEELARRLGATAVGAVRDADLSFSTRRAAADAPRLISERNDVETVLGRLAARYHESIEDASARLTNAAARSGLRESSLAQAMLLLQFP